MKRAPPRPPIEFTWMEPIVNWISMCDWNSSDLVNGMVLLMNSNISSPVNLVSSSSFYIKPLAHQTQTPSSSCYLQPIPKCVFNLQGNPEEHTILKFAQLIKSLVGKGPPIDRYLSPDVCAVSSPAISVPVCPNLAPFSLRIKMRFVQKRMTSLKVSSCWLYYRIFCTIWHFGV